MVKLVSKINIPNAYVMERSQSEASSSSTVISWSCDLLSARLICKSAGAHEVWSTTPSFQEHLKIIFQEDAFLSKCLSYFKDVTKLCFIT